MSDNCSGARMLHTMIRVRDLEKSIEFYTDFLGMKLLRRDDYPGGKFTLAFVGYGDESSHAVIELTHNWDQEEAYTEGRNFGHLAFQVENIYEKCQRLQEKGVTILRPPRDGYMAFIRSPDGISVELLQKGKPLEPKDPWQSQKNVGQW